MAGAAAFLGGVAATVAAGSSIDLAELPQPATVIADGRFEAGEWTRAAAYALAEGVILYLMADQERLYVATSSRSSGARYTDLYLADATGCLVNLHASMRLGERRLPADGWGDALPAWSWGNNRGWTANAVRAVRTRSPDGSLVFDPFDGQEFVIDRSRFQGELLVRVEVRDFFGQAPDLAYPAGSTREDRSTWAKVRVGGDAPANCSG